MRQAIGFSLLVGAATFSSSADAEEAWPRADADELLATVDRIGADGLDPVDYQAGPLRAALAGGESEAWSSLASTAFVRLAADLSNGHLRNRRAVAWHIVGNDLSEVQAKGLLETALATHQIRQTLVRLAPQHGQYLALKAALAATPARDKAGIERLRANLERWRWMPRNLGARYLLVNVPAFTVSLVQDGRVIERRRVIVGKRSTPTPQFAATVTGVIFNPWWDVPDSIVRESVGQLLRTKPALAHAQGYVVADGRIRQAPGPSNALGQVKLVMPNPYSVYLHDTPSKRLFDAEVRAFSHGCIRVQDPLGLATSLLGGGSGRDRRVIDRIVAGGQTLQTKLPQPIPVYVAYFTAAADETGAIATFSDIYGRDGPIVVSLTDAPVDVLS